MKSYKNKKIKFEEFFKNKKLIDIKFVLDDHKELKGYFYNDFDLLTISGDFFLKGFVDIPDILVEEQQSEEDWVLPITSKFGNLYEIIDVHTSSTNKLYDVLTNKYFKIYTFRVIFGKPFSQKYPEESDISDFYNYVVLDFVKNYNKEYFQHRLGNIENKIYKIERSQSSYEEIKELETLYAEKLALIKEQHIKKY